MASPYLRYYVRGANYFGNKSNLSSDVRRLTKLVVSVLAIINIALMLRVLSRIMLINKLLA